MTCSRERLESWLDDELDAAERSAVERHIETCADCAATAAQLRAQKAAIRSAAPYYRASRNLRQSIQTAVRAADRPSREKRWRWLAIAAAVLLAASASWNVLHLGSDESRAVATSHLAGSLFDNHMRSLVGTLVDVPSSDQHTVKPWFAGKLDFSPDVKNLDAEGFILAGGRLDYVGGRRVAALVYRRRQHVINLFTWPFDRHDSAASGAGEMERGGYNLVHWTKGPMACWAVSDVSGEELKKFRSLYEQ
ncbi:MAG TPA: anti-sigma factor [Bryobacteraceae bacterium]|nr:anti-sigma factor [Bryobacteraceae bacterium]